MANQPNRQVTGTPSHRTSTGRVVTRFGAAMTVQDASGHLHRCTAKRQLDYIVCGDIVDWQTIDQQANVITAVHPRRNKLTRLIDRGPVKVMAANIDQLVVVIASVPEPNLEMVDRYLVAAVAMACKALLVFNKSDLPCDALDIESIANEFRNLGYRVVKTSVTEKLGITELKSQLSNRISILVGQSGVGKSSLAKLLLSDENIRIGKLSPSKRKGRHTTTSATLYPLTQGGALIDSPGIRDFDPSTASLENLALGYVEFEPFILHCRFHNCTHTVEPGCAVIEAVEAGKINRRRLRSYQRLLQSLRA